jgi:hypothetical protein
MQCREARLRLAAYEGERSKMETDRELIDHLRECPDCARDFLAEKKLRQLYSQAGVNDTADVVPISRQRTRVEARASGEESRKSVGRMIPGLLWRKPGLSFGTVIAVAVLIILALVPFQYNRTVGYEITLEGVDQELAGDIERICDMLMAMGLEDAEVDILGCDTTCGGIDLYRCDTTCRLFFVELKTREEAQRVVEAFAQVDPTEVTSDIKPVRSSTRGTLLDKANETLFRD